MKYFVTCFVLFVLLLSVFGVAVADQRVSGSGKQSVPNQNKDSKGNTASLFNESTPLWQRLDRLSLSEKENALIHLEVLTDLTTMAKQRIEEVEELWNNGSFGQAIDYLRDLEESQGVRDVAAAISWKVPKETQNLKWGTDVQIGSYDRIAKSCLDFHYASGNLFAVLKRVNSDNNGLFLNISTDGGQTWQQIFEFWNEIWDISITVVDTSLFVGCVLYYSGQHEVAHLLKFSANTGAWDDAMGLYAAFDHNLDIDEIVLTSDADQNDSRIYYLGLVEDGPIFFHWSGNNGWSWNEIATGVTNAICWLDACFNKGYDDYWLLFSYFGMDGCLHVARVKGSLAPQIENSEFDCSGRPIYNISLAAYEDEVLVVYVDPDTNIKYLATPDIDGDPIWWYQDWLVSSPTRFFWKVDVTGRQGGGFAVVYVEDAYPNPNRCWFTHRAYHTSDWSAPEQFNEISSHLRPIGVEWIPPSEGFCHGYGATWCGGGYYPSAYFDRINLCPLRDPSGDGSLSPGDIIFLINYLFRGGSAPDPLEAGDATCDGEVGAADVAYLINYFFRNGPPPCCP
jgi:hypothetical protein